MTPTFSEWLEEYFTADELLYMPLEEVAQLREEYKLNHDL
jgi:hypothetical protein